MKNYKMTGKVIRDFNDKQDAGKNYEVGDTFTADKSRYEELYAKGLLEEGKKVEEKIFSKLKKNEDEE